MSSLGEGQGPQRLERRDTSQGHTQAGRQGPDSTSWVGLLLAVGFAVAFPFLLWWLDLREATEDWGHLQSDVALAREASARHLLETERLLLRLAHDPRGADVALSADAPAYLATHSDALLVAYLDAEGHRVATAQPDSASSAAVLRLRELPPPAATGATTWLLHTEDGAAAVAIAVGAAGEAGGPPGTLVGVHSCAGLLECALPVPLRSSYRLQLAGPMGVLAELDARQEAVHARLHASTPVFSGTGLVLTMERYAEDHWPLELVLLSAFISAMAVCMGALLLRLRRDVLRRRTAEAELMRSRHELEAQVAARTAELVESNRALQAEIEERRETQEALARALAEASARQAEVARLLDSLHAREKQMRAERDRAQGYLDIAEVAMVGLDSRGHIAMVNRRGCLLIGRSEDDLLGRDWFDLCIPEDTRAAVRDVFTQLMRGEVAVPEYYENEIVTVTGERRRVAWHNAVLRDAEGRPCGTLSSGEDVTELRAAEEAKERLEAHLRRVQRLESIGVMAGGIAHDFNNILGAILGYTELSLAMLAPTSPIEGHLSEVLRAAERARDLVQQILTFSRQLDQELRPTALAPLLKEAARFIRSSLPATIEVVAEVRGDDIVVMADPTRMHQVVMNLLTNGGYALGDSGGVLVVDLDLVWIDAAWAEELGGLQPGRYARITVRDTGCGMDEDTLARIFDPFFTTKPQGEGTGLGLALCHGIVASHGGAIDVDSMVGRGTTFRVYLPAISSQEELMGDARGEAPHGQGHVLVVDDEAPLADVVKQTLEGLGYRVTATTSSREALRFLQQDPEAYCALVTDLIMPHLTGIDLVRAVKRLNPSLPVVLITGYSQRVNAPMAREAGVAEFLMKPFTSRVLADALQRVLTPQREPAN